MPHHFASDNVTGAHSAILQAVVACNSGSYHAYGKDPYTVSADAKFRDHFGEEIAVYFVYGGTGANVLGLKSLTRSHQSVICADTAHINTDEGGAPEHYTGSKLTYLPNQAGKITLSQLQTQLAKADSMHQPQPAVLSLTQSTELGTVYTLQELKALVDCAHSYGLRFHLDGARLCNAAAHLNVSLRALTCEVGVDVLSFGGTKNGMLYGEAVVFFDPALAQSFKYIRKQGMQLASKMRFIAAQFEALLSDDLWLKNAQQANAMATLLAQQVQEVPGVEILYPVQANGIFAKLPSWAITPLQAQFPFYVWDEGSSVVRWMTAFDTTPEDVMAFSAAIQKTIKTGGVA
jgi:threonine aldolase